MNEKVLESKFAPLKKIYFGDFNRHYYTVSFYDKEDNSINLCSSSQIGCLEKCLFCATGDSPFVRNLSSEEISEQYLTGVNKMKKIINQENPKLLYIIMEGMGEPSYNLQNCLGGFLKSEKELRKQFDKICYRISTIGNTGIIIPYKKFIINHLDKIGSTEFQFQISLHSPFDKERRYLMPGSIGKTKGIKEISEKFSKFADFLGKKLKINYMLLNYPNGFNNYSTEHIEELGKIFNSRKTKIKLTKYSETGKRFYSPEDKTYEFVKNSLIDMGFETVTRELFGADINAACGMLHYQTDI